MTITGTYRSPARAGGEAYARAALARESAEVASTASGRNARINAAAYALGQLVGAGLLGEDEVISALLAAAEACGHTKKRSPAASLATVRSGLRAGIRSPRDIPEQSHRGGAPAVARPPDPAEEARRAHEREVARLAQQAEDRIKAERVRMIWDQAIDPRNGLVERYIAEHRGLALPPDACIHAIRFHQAGPWETERVPMMLCALRDIATNEMVGLHRTRLDPTTAAKVGRKMLGRARGAAIKLTHDSEVTMGLALAEGVETGLAGIALGLRPMWVMGSVGGIASFPVLAGVGALTLCAESGDASAAAVEECGSRWCEAGREVLISRSRRGADLADFFNKQAA